MHSLRVLEIHIYCRCPICFESLPSNSSINKLPNSCMYCICTNLSILVSSNSYSYYFYCIPNHYLYAYFIQLNCFVLTEKSINCWEERNDTAWFFQISDPFSKRPVSLRFSNSIEAGIVVVVILFKLLTMEIRSSSFAISWQEKSDFPPSQNI